MGAPDDELQGLVVALNPLIFGVQRAVFSHSLDKTIHFMKVNAYGIVVKTCCNLSVRCVQIWTRSSLVD